MKLKRIQIILSIFLCFNVLFSPVIVRAQWVTADIPSGVGAGAGIFGDAGIFAQLGTTIGKYVKENWESMTLAASKMAALFAVQKITTAIIGSGDGGSITDYRQYLFGATQQTALNQVNSFFNTVSQGRLSSLNYEGVGRKNYDAYLVAQARQAIGGHNFSTNIQSQVSSPTQMFTTGNMKGIMTYMQCANNPACYTLTSVAKYNSELVKAQEIAKAEQDKGFLPQKQNGKIVKPAALLSSALTQVDQLGTQVIMNADLKAGLTAGEIQIAQGALMNIAARSLNYAFSDSAGKAAIRNANDQFPFSLGYTLNTGIGLTAGGVTLNTGAGAIASQTMIGNTCATSAAAFDPTNGAVVSINGQKYNCSTKTVVAGTGPSVNLTAPTISCTTDSACNIGKAAGTYICRQGSCVKR